MSSGPCLLITTLLVTAARVHAVCTDGDPSCRRTASGSTFAALRVESAKDDTDFAKFFINDYQVPVEAHADWNVVTLDPGTFVVHHSQSFNVDNNQAVNGLSEALEVFLDGLAEGTLVLVTAFAKHASWHLSEEVRAALERCGAAKAGRLGSSSEASSSSYALIGTKGGQAHAEEALKSGGSAVAVAWVNPSNAEVVDPVVNAHLLKPKCDTTARVPPVAGYLKDGNLILDEQCRHELRSSSDASACLQGLWVVFIGASQQTLTFGDLVNWLVDGNDFIDPSYSTGWLYSYTFIDVIVQDGKVIYYDKFQLCPRDTKSSTDPDCLAAVQNALAAAPVYDPRATRMTKFMGSYFDRVHLALPALKADVGWASAEFVVHVQILNWYVYSAFYKDKWGRAEMQNMSSAQSLTFFEAEAFAALTELDHFCGNDQVRGCYVLSRQYTTGYQKRISTEDYEHWNYALQKIAMSTQSLRYLDYQVLSRSMPEEQTGGHYSQVTDLWSLQIILGGVCDAATASDATWATFVGATCHADKATYDDCPTYTEERNNCVDTHCEFWECIHTEPCEMQVVTKKASVSEGATDPADAEAPEVIPDTDANSSSLNGDPSNGSASDGNSSNRNSSEDNFSSITEPEKLTTTKAPTPAPTPAPTLAPTPAPTPVTMIFPNVTFSSIAEARTFASENRLWNSPDSEWLPTAIAAVLAMFTLLWVKFRERRQDVAKKAEAARLPSSVAGKASEEAATAALAAAEEGASLPRLMHSKSNRSIAPSHQKSNDGVDLKDVEFALSIIPHASPDQNASEDGTATAKDSANPAAASTATEANSPAAKKTTVATASALEKFPLGLARFCASMHVVVGHLYAKGVTQPAFLFGWGFTWVPWFFMLSGFVLFSAYLKKPKVETIVDYVMRRSVTIYPLYAFSLLPAFAISKGLNKMAADVWTLIAQSFLLQASWPGIAEKALQQHCWFLSCMVVYWALFKPLSFCFKGLTLLRTCLLMALAFSLPWLVLVGPAIAEQPLDWYRQHRFSQTDTALDLGVIILKFHPVCYLHVFIIGMLLAKLRMLLDQKSVSAGLEKLAGLIMQFVAPFGYLVLLLVFNVDALRPEVWGYKLSARLVALLPFQAMILFGLAGLPSLPPSIFSRFCSKFDFLERYSYAVYVFQFLCYAVWPNPGQINLCFFLLFTAAAAVLIFHFVQDPLQKMWSNHPKARMLVPLILAVLLAGLSFIPGPGAEQVNFDIVEELHHDERMVDVRLPLSDQNGIGVSLMNPSLTISRDKVAVAARRHNLESVRYVGSYNGQDATIVDHIWHSQILLGTVPINVTAWADWPKIGRAPFDAKLQDWTGLQTPSGGKWTDLCVRETWIPENSTLIRKVVTGPEDPKVIARRAGVSVAFSSLPPLEAGGCDVGEEVTQMYLAQLPDSNATAGQMASMRTVGNRLRYGTQDKAEKNWIPFTYKDSLFFVYSPLPHKIVASWNDGASQEVFSSSFGPLRRFQQDHPEIDVRGSGQAVLIDDALSTPNYPGEHYLALLHLYNRTSRQYAHFAYRFRAAPPFDIQQISQQLPLVEATGASHSTPFAFASGLVVHSGTVAISYGAGDRDARALVLTLDRLDDMFVSAGLSP